MAPKFQPKFQPGDVCFAKMRGYPAWPAKVEAVISGEKTKYQIYFFGTGESAIMNCKDLYPYIDNEKLYDKPLKRKGYNEGLLDLKAFLISKTFVSNAEEKTAEDIPKDDPKKKSAISEEEPQPSCSYVVRGPKCVRRGAQKFVTKKEKGLLYGTTDNFAPKKTLGMKRKVEPKVTESAKKTSGVKKWKPDAPRVTSISALPRTRPGVPKKFRKQLKDLEVIQLQIEAPKVTDLSGPHAPTEVTPKNRSEDELSQQVNDSITLPLMAEGETSGPERKITPKETVANRESKHRVKRATDDFGEFNHLAGPFYIEEDAGENDVIDATSGLKGQTILAKTNTGQIVKVKIDFLRPTFFPDRETQLRYDEAVARSAHKLKHDIREGLVTVDDYVRKCKVLITKNAEERNERAETKKGTLRWMQCEQRLLEIDMQLRINLSITGAVPENCTDLLDELFHLVEDPFMLKKHPNVVESMKRLRKYVGNIDAWNMTDPEKVEFRSMCSIIRMKSDMVYGKMRSLFCTPDNSSFWKFFAEKVTKYKTATNHMTLRELCQLTEDPLK